MNATSVVVVTWRPDEGCRLTCETGCVRGMDSSSGLIGSRDSIRSADSRMSKARRKHDESEPRLEVAVLIATRDRRDMLESRALDSIVKQTRQPDYLVLVEDTTDPRRPSTRRVVHKQAMPNTQFILLRNERRQGAAGAWNTGIDHLLRRVRDPKRVYLAVLDDDDRYDPSHIEWCLDRAGKREVDMVTVPLMRHESLNDPGRRRKVPDQLRPGDFLVSSQHIQGSNLFLRLSTILAAGLFDEGQTSVTDRDLMIRVSELPNVKYRKRATATVHHYAEPERARMSSPRSRTRCVGLTQFHRKWRTRMSEEQERSSRGRARDLFGWTEPPQPFDHRIDPPSVSGARIESGVAQTRVIVASVADVASAAQLARFVSESRESGCRPELLAIERAGSGEASFAAAFDAVRAAGIQVTTVSKHESAALGEGLAPTAIARALLRRRMLETPGTIGWLIDPNVRLGARIAAKGGSSRVRGELASELAALSKTKGVFFGTQTGMPDLPALAMLRSQLVDLYHNLHWLGRLDASDALPDRGVANALERRGRIAFFDDGAAHDTDVLERPFWIEPNVPGESVAQAIERLAVELPGILIGRQVFRPNVLEASDSHTAARVSDGHLIVTDPDRLVDMPTLGGAYAISPTRRRALERVFASAFGAEIATTKIVLDRELPPPAQVSASALDLDALLADVRGAALHSAFESLYRWRIETGRDARSELDAVESARFERWYRRARSQRLGALSLSLRRVGGVVRSILRSTQRDRSPWAFWWSRATTRQAIDSIRSTCREVLTFTKGDPLGRMRIRAKREPDDVARSFFRSLEDSLASARRLHDSKALAEFAGRALGVSERA